MFSFQKRILDHTQVFILHKNFTARNIFKIQKIWTSLAFGDSFFFVSIIKRFVNRYFTLIRHSYKNPVPSLSLGKVLPFKDTNEIGESTEFLSKINSRERIGWVPFRNSQQLFIAYAVVCRYLLLPNPTSITQIGIKPYKTNEKRRRNKKKFIFKWEILLGQSLDIGIYLVCISQYLHVPATNTILSLDRRRKIPAKLLQSLHSDCSLGDCYHVCGIKSPLSHVSWNFPVFRKQFEMAQETAQDQHHQL